MANQQHSRFWVVSTLVLTTGFALPFLALLATTGLIAATGSRAMCELHNWPSRTRPWRARSAPTTG